MIKELINDFLDIYGIKILPTESEQMMDDHFCIDYYGTEYYIPQNNSLFTEDEIIIQVYLEAVYSV